MNAAIIVPIIVGICTILQSGLNNKVSGDWGLSKAVFLTCLLTVFISGLFMLIVKATPQSFPSILHLKGGIGDFKWWWLIPAFFGVTIVIGLPYAFFKVGAVNTIITMIASQMITSVLWDIYVEKLPINTMKSLGVLFALISVGLVTFSNS